MLRLTRIPALTAMLLAFAGAGVAHAGTRYPYTLIDPGTFGGPSSYLDEPGVPLTTQGTLVGAADTSTPDSSSSSCPSNFCDGYEQHGFTWSDGKLTDLAPLPGFNDSNVYELNNHGVAAGSSISGLDPTTLFTEGQATIWPNGQAISLGTLPGGTRSFAQDINDRGQVAGMSSNGTPDPLSFFEWGTQTRAFIWKNGVMTDLGTLGGPDTIQNNMNEQGQVAGWSYTNDIVNATTGLPTVDPFLWENGHMRDLGSLGGTFGVVNWLNDRGEVAGQSDLPGDQSFAPFLWDGRRMIDLGTLGGDFGSATSVNQRGDVAGWSALPGDQSFDGFLWRHGKMIDLPPAGGAPSAFPNSINDLDQVVGNENDADGNEIIAALWSGSHGYDLNTLVAPNHMQMISADYINDQGDIVGHGVLPNGDQRMFLLIRNPSVPLPTTPIADGPLTDALNAAGPVTSAGVADQSPNAAFALTTVRHGIKAGIHQLMRNLGR
jgi:probable HAF family extracellular repeat protein